MIDGNLNEKQKKTLKPKDIVAMKIIDEVAISPNGEWAAFVLTELTFEEGKDEYYSHIWLVSTSGDKLLQLTDGLSKDNDPQWSPDSNYIAFVSKQANDREQIMVISVLDGKAIQVTHAKNGTSSPRWSPDGKQIAFLMEEDQSEQMHLWTANVELIMEVLFYSLLDGKLNNVSKENLPKNKWIHRLTEGAFHVSDPQWSPDSRQIAFVSTPSSNEECVIFDATIYVINVETRTFRKLTYNDKGGEIAPRWSPEGNLIAFLYRTSNDIPFQRDIYIIPAENGIAAINLTSDFNRNEGIPIWPPNSDVIYFETTDGVRRHIYSLSTNNGRIQQITSGDCVISGMSIAADGDTYIFCYETPNMPKDIWVGSISTRKLKKITNMNPQIVEFALCETCVVKWKSCDGLEIEGILCIPSNKREGVKCPLLVIPHGGPHRVVGLHFDPVRHYFSGEGFCIFLPNFRGSDGYGYDFAGKNYQNWGIGDYQDIMTGVDYLIEQKLVDPDNMVVGGWSYGGFMTLCIITQTNRFKSASSGGAPSNFAGILYSPIAYVHQISTPLLMLHGISDKRVPIEQVEEFYTKLKSVGVIVDFVKYIDEGHVIEKPYNILDSLERQLTWYKKYMTHSESEEKF